jgi:hypothetical protein
MSRHLFFVLSIVTLLSSHQGFAQRPCVKYQYFGYPIKTLAPDASDRAFAKISSSLLLRKVAPYQAERLHPEQNCACVVSAYNPKKEIFCGQISEVPGKAGYAQLKVSETNRCGKFPDFVEIERLKSSYRLTNEEGWPTSVSNRFPVVTIGK